ncbi:MAG: cob(I)yrinic acid a,c-diamide adenosyltransferase [Nitrospinae bacterium]|nr:cob(I)yrinic acid a,c-diamide adenosyltransferase [Nitrospinota bacterium]
MDKKFKKGIVQVYTGDGKGKTTAAIGLALRAAGQGFKVYMIQFLKSPKLSSGEFKMKDAFGNNLKLERLNTPWWSLKSFKNDKHVEKMKEFLKEEMIKLKDIISSGKYNLIILDEINICLFYGLIDLNDVIELIKNKPADLEIVLTGRYAPEELKKIADLVTEMKLIKHPFSTGLKARRGIEY